MKKEEQQLNVTHPRLNSGKRGEESDKNRSLLHTYKRACMKDKGQVHVRAQRVICTLARHNRQQ